MSGIEERRVEEHAGVGQVPRRVIVVEDNEIAADWATAQITSAGEFVVAGRARTQAEAEALIRELDFDIVLLDIELDERRRASGLILIPLVHDVRPEAKVVLFSEYLEIGGEVLRQALQKAAYARWHVDGMVSKSDTRELSEILRYVGNPHFPLVLSTTVRIAYVPGYSALDDMNANERRVFLDYIRSPVPPREQRKRLFLGRSAFDRAMEEVRRKVTRQMREEQDPETPTEGTLVSREALTHWAREHQLDWIIELTADNV